MSQTHLRSELGVDFETYKFSNSLTDTARDYTVSRSLSSHFLDLRLEGPLVNSHFADYSARARFSGTYYRASTEGSESDAYIKPSIPIQSASLSVFPTRAYPLTLNYQKSRDQAVRYESNNRSELDIISPELAIVRRYELDTWSRGAIWKLGIAKGVDFTSEYKTEDSRISRNYDFREDKDIWVVFTVVREEPAAFEHTITVKNQIVDDTVMVFIDLDSVLSLAPGQTTVFTLDSGVFEVDFVPLKRNPYRQTVSVHGDMVWQIVFNPPAAPNDLDQGMTTASAVLRVGGSGRFQSESQGSYSDTREEVQSMTTLLSLFSNTSSYEISPTTKLRTLTTYNQNDMMITGLTSQLAKNFSHQTSVHLMQKRGLSSLLSHTYTYMSNRTVADTLADTVISNMHLLTNSNTYPIDKWHYTFDLRNSMNLLSDNRDYVNNQYTTEIGNRFDWEWQGVRWVPRAQYKYSYNTQQSASQPDQTGNETEAKQSLTATIPECGVLGRLEVRGDYDWRRREAGDGGGKTLSRYFLDLSARRKFGKSWSVNLTANQEKEVSGGEASGAGRPSSVTQQDVVKSSYKVDIQMTPWDQFNLGVNVMTIGQTGSRITRLAMSLSAEIPKLEIPVRSFLQAESRKLEGLPDQTSFMIETTLSYRFRQISLVLKHSYNREGLLTETYDYQEVTGRLSRNFGIF